MRLMSTDKGGSDLDVFNDLKPQTPDGKPIIDNRKTLMGIPVPDGSLPPVPGNSALAAPRPRSTRSVPPPPPSQRPRRPGAPPSSSRAIAPLGLGPVSAAARGKVDEERAED